MSEQICLINLTVPYGRGVGQGGREGGERRPEER